MYGSLIPISVFLTLYIYSPGSESNRSHFHQTFISFTQAIMKRIRCPKCDEPIIFDETKYEPGRVLVFVCPACNKQFKIRMPQLPKTEVSSDETGEGESELAVYGKLVVIENAFHFKQEIPLYEGENVVGRYVKGTKANAAIKTVDPSMDTTHCIITVRVGADETPKFVLRDAPSNTGTFLQNEILGNKDRVTISEGDIITIGATTMILRTAMDAME